MAHALVGLFATRYAAEQAMRDLQSAGFTQARLGQAPSDTGGANSGPNAQLDLSGTGDAPYDDSRAQEGGTLVVVDEQGRDAEAQAILRRNGARDIREADSTDFPLNSNPASAHDSLTSTPPHQDVPVGYGQAQTAQAANMAPTAPLYPAGAYQVNDAVTGQPGTPIPSATGAQSAQAQPASMSDASPIVQKQDTGVAQQDHIAPLGALTRDVVPPARDQPFPTDADIIRQGEHKRAQQARALENANQAAPAPTPPATTPATPAAHATFGQYTNIPAQGVTYRAPSEPRTADQTELDYGTAPASSYTSENSGAQQFPAPRPAGDSRDDLSGETPYIPPGSDQEPDYGQDPRLHSQQPTPPDDAGPRETQRDVYDQTLREPPIENP